MFISHQAVRIFVFRQAIDMRYGFERLCHLVREHFKAEVQSGHVYLFLGKNRRRAKVMTYDGSGLLLIHKRLEIGLFARVADVKGQLSAFELAAVLAGGCVRPHKVEGKGRKAAPVH